MKILVLTHNTHTIQTIQKFVPIFQYEYLVPSEKNFDQYVVNRLEHGIYRVLFKKEFDVVVIDEYFLNLLKKYDIGFQDSDISQHAVLLIVSDYAQLDMESVKKLRVSSMIKTPVSADEFHAHISMIYTTSQINLKTSRWAFSDSLTGLFNRRTFIGSMTSYFSECRECDIPFTLVMLDLDHFKFINDTYGHYAGDRLLKVFSDVMSRNIRVVDFLARIGGEEFAIILPMSTPEEAEIILKRIRKDFSESNEVESFLKVTFSAGVVASADHFKNIDEMLHVADKLLYKAKEEGRDRICL